MGMHDSFEAGMEVLRTLVARHEGLTAPDIIRCHLNSRGRNPAAVRRLEIHVEYPEPGVIRRYCGGDVLAWMDEVVGSTEFRKPAMMNAIRAEAREAAAILWKRMAEL